MSTRSCIAIENKDGTLTAVYCHYNGYLSGVGRTLYNHYYDEKMIRELLSYGDISSLESEIGVKHDFDDRSTTTFYGRDRDECDVEARIISDDSELFEIYDWSDYYYKFSNGEWLVKNRGSNNWKFLEDELR